MVKTVYILRHAKAESASEDQPDIERHLAERGYEDCKLMGVFMRDHKYEPDFVLCSAATRTRETFDLVMKAARMNPPSKIDRKLYMTSPEQIIAMLQHLDGKLKSVMVVGHNPVMHQLANILAEENRDELRKALRMKYPTGTLTVLRFAVDSWEDVVPDKGQLADFMSPSDI